MLVTGCATEYNLATGKQETLIFSEEKEISIGTNVAAKIDKHYEDKIFRGVEENQRVQEILDKIVAVSDRQDLVYFIKIIDEDMVNAVSLPGGYVYLFKGLLDRIENDDQLAGIIAHEVGHITAKHGIKRLQASYGAMLLQVAAFEAGDSRFAGGVGLALNSLFMEYSQQAEFEADNLSVKYLKKAGYDPQGMVEVLEILREANEDTVRQFSYFKTHPGIAKRISNANREITGELKFKDYLNLMEEYE